MLTNFPFFGFCVVDLEMGSAAAKLLNEPENKALAESAFKAYDKDKSGRLDDIELLAFAADLLKGLGNARPQLLMSELNPNARSKTEDTLAKAAKKDSPAFRELRTLIILALMQGGHKTVSLEHFLSFDWSNIEEITKSIAADQERWRSAKSMAEVLREDPSLAGKAFDYVTRMEDLQHGGMSEKLFASFFGENCVTPWQEAEGKPAWHNLGEPEQRFWKEAFFRVFTGSTLASRVTKDQWCAAPWTTLKSSILGNKMSLEDYLKTLEGTYEVSGYGMVSRPPMAHTPHPQFLVSIRDGSIKAAVLELRGYVENGTEKVSNPVAKCSKIEMTPTGFRLHFAAADFHILSPGGGSQKGAVHADVVAEADLQLVMTEIDYSSKGKFFFPQWSVNFVVQGKQLSQLQTDKEKAKFVPKNGHTIFQFVALDSGWTSDKKKFIWTRWDPLDSKWYTAESVEQTILPLLKLYSDL